MRTLIIAGVALRGDGYPNAVNTIALLRESGSWHVDDRAHWLPDHVRLWHLVRGGMLARLGLVLRLVLGGAAQAAGLLIRARRTDLVYLPYPAPITLWWITFVPERWRPRCIADAYISLWDSMFRDREGGDVEGWASRMARAFEARSLGAAVKILVDTEANKRQMVADFALRPDRVRSLPLAIDAAALARVGERCLPQGRCKRVLFVGTLVPLHGIEVVLKATAKLIDDDEIEFRLVGDGQQGKLVEAFVRTHPYARLTWVREWMSLAQIAREISEADICLGVFGGAGKAARVLPFKLYYALAAGKAIVTQGDYSLPRGVPPLPVECIGQNPDFETQLVAAIRRLLADDAVRVGLEQEASRYFDQHLAGHAIMAAWDAISRA